MAVGKQCLRGNVRGDERIGIPTPSAARGWKVVCGEIFYTRVCNEMALDGLHRERHECARSAVTSLRGVSLLYSGHG